jgi:hypothetical protein
MDKAKLFKTPICTNGHLDLNLDGTSIDQKVYHSMIGSLLYLCTSRPDIMLSVCKILSCTQRLPFKGGQENHEVYSSHT